MKYEIFKIKRNIRLKNYVKRMNKNEKEEVSNMCAKATFVRRTQQHFQAEIDRLELKLHFTFESVAWNELSAVILCYTHGDTRECVWFLIRILQTFFSAFFFHILLRFFDKFSYVSCEFSMFHTKTALHTRTNE